MSPTLTFFGAVVAAIIAAAVALVSLIVAKENKISEHRQAWIDAFRTDVALVLANCNTWTSLCEVDYKNLSDRADAMKDVALAISTSVYNIRLRLNPKNNHATELLTAIQGLIKQIQSIEQGKPNNLSITSNEKDVVVKLAHILLKEEWERVKAGELSYRITKYAGFIIISVGLGLALFEYKWF